MENVNTTNTERIQDYILANEELHPKEEQKTAAPKKKASVMYEVVLENGIDFVIERKTAKSSMIFACIPSSRQFYVKKDGETEAMTSENLNKFLASATGPIELEQTAWIDKISKGIKFTRYFCSFVQRYAELIAKGYAYMGPEDSFCGQTVQKYMNTDEKVYRFLLDKKLEQMRWNIKDLYQNTGGRNPWRRSSESYVDQLDNNYEWLHIFKLQYGLDMTKKLISVMQERNLGIRCNTSTYLGLVMAVDATFNDIMSHYFNRSRYYDLANDQDATVQKYFGEISLKHNEQCFNPKRFIEYCSMYQYNGFRALGDFISYWKDTLNMQKTIYGKIKDKYPQNLQVEHDRLSLKVDLMKEMKDQKLFAESAEDNKILEWSNPEWIVIIPKTPEEMANEAINQNNCLRSYIGQVARGETRIAFLRRKKTPDTSLITIEIHGDDTIGQVKGAHNRNARPDEVLAVAEWAKARDLTYTTMY